MCGQFRGKGLRRDKRSRRDKEAGKVKEAGKIEEAGKTKEAEGSLQDKVHTHLPNLVERRRERREHLVRDVLHAQAAHDVPTRAFSEFVEAES